MPTASAAGTTMPRSMNLTSQNAVGLDRYCTGGRVVAHRVGEAREVQAYDDERGDGQQHDSGRTVGGKVSLCPARQRVQVSREAPWGTDAVRRRATQRAASSTPQTMKGNGAMIASWVALRAAVPKMCCSHGV